MKICLCVGTRPNFIKAAPLIRAFKKHDIEYRLVHTGQHYDYNMSEIFFEELGIPKPDIVLRNRLYSKRLWAISETMEALKEDCKEYKPDLIMVLGDVNSTFACALAAKSMNIKLAHIEAGERCGDDNMVEERNRKKVDAISDYLFCASENSIENLIDEGIAMDRETHLVGNTMIDQLKYIQPLIQKTEEQKEDPYAVLTLHRAENVDNLERLRKIWGIILKVSEKINVIFPCHPRTKKQLEKLGFLPIRNNIIFKKPLSYLEFMKLVNNAKFVMTDSGGLQIETSYLNIPCITLRDSTEWLETVSHGTNVVTGIAEEDILKCVDAITIFQGIWKTSLLKANYLHDGNSAERIVEVLKKGE